MKKIICLLLIVSSSIAFAQESALLRYNYKKGDKYKMTLVMKQNMGIAGGIDMSMESAINVVSSDNKKFQLSSQAKRVKMDMAQGNQNIKFDSDAKDSELDAQGRQMKAQFQSVLKTTAYHTFDEYGKMIDVKTVPANSGTKPQDLLGYTNFPKEAVKVGTTWSQDLSVEGMKLKMIYKVKEVSKSNVIAEVTGTLAVMGVQSNLTGSVTFDRKTGNTDLMSINSTMNLQGITASINAEVKIQKI